MLVQVREPIEQMRAAGNLMYFGGDLAELPLALVLLATRQAKPVASVPTDDGTPRSVAVSPQNR